MNAALILVAFAATAAADLQGTLDEQRIAQEIPGVSAVVTRRDEVLFAGGSGKADLESGDDMTADTVVYAGSLSKILTTVLALQLVAADDLSLEQTLPGIARPTQSAIQTVSLRHLLTHTSGLPREGNFAYWFSADFPDSSRLDEYLATTELLFEPGTDTRYSNIGFAAVGAIIERADGQPFSTALVQRVLQPLGMNDSGAPGPAPGVATGYTPNGRMIPDEERPFAGVGRKVGERHVREYHNAHAMTPAFGIYTSARDFGRLTQFLLGYGGDAVLSREMRQRMLTSEGEGRGLGLGVGKYKGRSVARHGGWFAAHRSYVLLDLEAKIGVAVFANSDSASPPDIAKALLDVALVQELQR